VFGQGVPQDYVKTYMWFNLALSRRSDTDTRNKAVKNRDEAAAMLTPAQIAEAAREWKPK